MIILMHSDAPQAFIAESQPYTKAQKRNCLSGPLKLDDNTHGTKCLSCHSQKDERYSQAPEPKQLRSSNDKLHNTTLNPNPAHKA